MMRGDTRRVFITASWRAIVVDIAKKKGLGTTDPRHDRDADRQARHDHRQPRTPTTDHVNGNAEFPPNSSEG